MTDERSPSQLRGTLVTAIKNNSARLRVMLGEDFEKSALDKKFDQIKTNYKNFVLLIEENEIPDVDDASVHELYSEVRGLMQGSKLESHDKAKHERLIQSVTIPPPEKFDGDPTKFGRWKTSVRAMMRRSASPDEMILILLESTKGEALDIIERFADNPCKSSVDDALKLLEENYGSDCAILETFLQQIEAFPPIAPGDGGGLKSYSNLLHRALSLQQRSPVISAEFESMTIKKRLISKLPFELQSKFIAPLVKSEPKNLSLQDLVNLVDKTEKILNHPMVTSN